MLNSMRDVAKSSISHAFYTYAHINPTTNKIFYIGKGTKNRYKTIEKRNIHWKNIVNKYGFNAEILAYWDTESEAFDHERLLISCFKDMGYKLANKTDGGEGPVGYKHTQEFKNRVSEKLKGKIVSKETKEKLRISALKRPKRIMSEESKKKISESLKGKPRSEETKKKISIAHQGNKHCLGKKCSEETKKKISEKLKGRIISEESRLKMIATKLAKRNKL